MVLARNLLLAGKDSSARLGKIVTYAIRFRNRVEIERYYLLVKVLRLRLFAIILIRTAATLGHRREMQGIQLTNLSLGPLGLTRPRPVAAVLGCRRPTSQLVSRPTIPAPRHQPITPWSSGTTPRTALGGRLRRIYGIEISEQYIGASVL